MKASENKSYVDWSNYRKSWKLGITEEEFKGFYKHLKVTKSMNPTYVSNIELDEEFERWLEIKARGLVKRFWGWAKKRLGLGE